MIIYLSCNAGHAVKGSTAVMKIPSRVVPKLGKCPDSVGYVLGVELGNEDQALINRALQEVVVGSEAKCCKCPQCVLDSLRGEVLELGHGSRHDSTQQWHSCNTDLMSTPGESVVSTIDCSSRRI